jgi:Transposase IS66 family
MEGTNSPKHIQLPTSEVNVADLIQRVSDENFQLRQIIDQMTNTLAMQKELIQQLKDEISRLKGQKPKPDIRPSKLEGQKRKPNWRKRIGLHNNSSKTVLFSMWVYPLENTSSEFLSRNFLLVSEVLPSLRAHSIKIARLAGRMIKKVRRLGKPGQPKGKPRQKKKTLLQIHEKPVIHPKKIPEGAKFKGYNRYTVQELILKPYNIQYQLARWQLPDGSYITGELPKNIQGHYGPELVVYILHQYYGCRVTEELLLNQLRARGTLISAGQLNNILIENKDPFIKEVAELLPIAARLEEQVQVDDTGGRHKGQNQYTTIIGNRWFSAFTTTDSKSRVNFLKLLQGSKEEYLINEDTLDYLSQVNVPSYFRGYVSICLGKKITNLSEWEQFLRDCNITQKAEVRFLTEAALYASAIQNGIPKSLGVHSDDAGQFDVFIHSLCWIHEERHYRKLIMTTNEARADLKRVENQLWGLYQELKTYQENPNDTTLQHLEKRFDDIFQQKTSSPTLNHQLSKTHKKKAKLLRVLYRPGTPLHNNASETDARSAKIKLKISGGTRSDKGKKARDTFLSLQQTCRKLGINFVAFLQDRVRGLYEIPRLATVIYKLALDESSLSPTFTLSTSLNLDLLQSSDTYRYPLTG